MREKYVIFLAEPALVAILARFTLPQAWIVVPMADWASSVTRLEEQPLAPDLLVLLRSCLDSNCLRQVDAWCQHHAISWTQFHLDQQSGWLGPLVIPGATASYHDLLVRRLAVAANEATHQALTALPYPAGWAAYLPAHSELTWMLAVLLAELERWAKGQPCGLLSTEIAADPLTLRLTRYPVLPLPDQPLHRDWQVGVPVSPALLVNPRSGLIIRTVEAIHAPFVPRQLKTIQSHVAYMGWHNPRWHNDTICGGSAFVDPVAARQAAIGEAVERYCGSFMGATQPIRASYEQLRARGEHAIDPEQLILFNDRVYQRPDCPLVPFQRDTPTYWVAGRSLTRDCPAWLPMSLVYFNWDRSRFADQPFTNWVNYAGIAAGPTLEQALLSGIEELIERDSTMVWWYNRPALPALALPPALAQIWQDVPDHHAQRAWLIHIPNEFAIPVMAGVVEHQQEQLLTIGFACRANPVQAALKAWSEALILEESAYDLLQPDGRNYQAIAAGWLPNALQPWRADRSYLDAYRPDFSDVRHLLMHLQLALDPRLIAQIRPWLDRPAAGDMAAIPSLSERSLAAYRQRIEARGYELFYCDITLPDIALTGLRVVRVIIPGLVPNVPAAFPPLGRERIRHMAVQRGWYVSPLPEAELNYVPMPHS